MGRNNRWPIHLRGYPTVAGPGAGRNEPLRAVSHELYKISWSAVLLRQMAREITRNNHACCYEMVQRGQLDLTASTRTNRRLLFMPRNA